MTTHSVAGTPYTVSIRSTGAFGLLRRGVTNASDQTTSSDQEAPRALALGTGLVRSQWSRLHRSTDHQSPAARRTSRLRRDRHGGRTLRSGRTTTRTTPQG